MTIVMPDGFEDIPDCVVEFTDGGSDSLVAQIVTGAVSGLLGIASIACLFFPAARAFAPWLMGGAILTGFGGKLASGFLGIKEQNALQHSLTMAKLPTPGI